MPFDFERGVLKEPLERREEGLFEDEGIPELVRWLALFFWILLIESLIFSHNVTTPQQSFFHLSYFDFTIGFSVWAIFMIPAILSSKRPGRMSLPASWDHFSLHALLLIFLLVLAKIGE